LDIFYGTNLVYHISNILNKKENNLHPSYWLIWVEKEPNRKFSNKFKSLEDLNDFLQALRADNIESVEVISGFCLEKR